MAGLLWQHKTTGSYPCQCFIISSVQRIYLFAARCFMSACTCLLNGKSLIVLNDIAWYLDF